MKTTSVIIDSYNSGRYIAACIDSVLNQTRPADEIIVYDDGSTDESIAILRAYGDRITLIEGVHDATRPDRASQAHALWRAFERSRGAWVFLLDGDDTFEPVKIERVLRAVEGRRGVSLVQSPVRRIDASGREFGGHRDPRFHCTDIHAAIYQQHDVDFFYPTSAMVVHRAALARVLPLDMSFCPLLPCDTQIGMLMPLLGEVITLDEYLASWRRHGASFSAVAARSRWYRLQQTVRRVRTFNHSAARYAAPPISLWRNRRLYGQAVGALLPEAWRRRLRSAAGWDAVAAKRTGEAAQASSPALA